MVSEKVSVPYCTYVVTVCMYGVGKCNFEKATEPTHQADRWRSSGLNFDISSFSVHKLFCVEDKQVEEHFRVGRNKERHDAMTIWIFLICLICTIILRAK